MSIGLPDNAFSIPSTQLRDAGQTRFDTGSDYIAQHVVRRSQRDDDGLAENLARRLSRQQFGDSRSLRDLNGAITAGKAADSSLESIELELDRLAQVVSRAMAAREDNATDANKTNGVLRDAQRDQLQGEFDEIVARIDELASGTQFGDSSLFGAIDGEDGGLVFAARDGSTLELALRSQSTEALGLVGLDVATGTAERAIGASIERIRTARDDVASFESGVVASIEQELRSVRRGDAIDDSQEAEALAEDTRRELITTGLSSELLSPRLDSASLALFG